MSDNEYSQKFTRYYKKYYQKVLNFVISLCKDEYTAEDITQSTFLTVWQHKYYSDCRKGKFLTLLCQIAKHRTADYYRKPRKCQLFDFIEIKDDYDVEKEVIRKEQRRQIYKAILMVPKIYRRVYILYEIKGYTHREIAEKLNINEITARGRLLRAREKILHTLLKEGIKCQFFK